MPPNGTRLTLLTLHRRIIAEPVFNAHSVVDLGNDQIPKYRHLNSRARPVACIDRTEFCSEGSKKCWDEGSQPDPQSLGFRFMKMALEHSTMYHSMAYRRQNTFQAQKLVTGALSDLPIDDQWMYEMEHLFATSLARIQWDAWAIGTGEGRDKPDYIRQFPENSEVEELCQLWDPHPKQFRFTWPLLISSFSATLIAIYLVPLSRSMLQSEIQEIRGRSFSPNWTRGVHSMQDRKATG
jgi:hypothetical protein